MDFPKLPKETTPFLWGAAIGTIALAVVGFNWGGWMTGGGAEKFADARAEKAVIAALTPVCVAQFQKAGDAKGRLVALKELKSWEQGEFVGKAGWATMPGSTTEPNSAVASACAEALNKLAP